MKIIFLILLMLVATSCEKRIDNRVGFYPVRCINGFLYTDGRSSVPLYNTHGTLIRCSVTSSDEYRGEKVHSEDIPIKHKYYY